MNTTENSQSIFAIRLAETTSQAVLAVYPEGPAVLFMPSGKRQRSYGDYPCYAHPITTEADVKSLHMLVAGVLQDGPKVVTLMIDMRCDLPLDWNSRVSSIFFRDSGLGTVRTAGSWLTMQPVSPHVLTLLAALEPRMLRPGAVEYPRASKAEVTMFRDLLSGYLRESSDGKGLHDSAQYDHSVGVSELERSVGTLLKSGIGPITPSDILKTGCALRLCLMVRNIGHGREAGIWLNVALNLANSAVTNHVLQKNRDLASLPVETRNAYWKSDAAAFSMAPLLENPAFYLANTEGIRAGYLAYCEGLVHEATAAMRSDQRSMATLLTVLAELALDQVLRLWYTMDDDAALMIRANLGKRADPVLHPSLLPPVVKRRCALEPAAAPAQLVGSLLPIAMPESSHYSLRDVVPKGQFVSPTLVTVALPARHRALAPVAAHMISMRGIARICPPIPPLPSPLLGFSDLCLIEMLAPKHTRTPLLVLQTLGSSPMPPWHATAAALSDSLWGTEPAQDQSAQATCAVEHGPKEVRATLVDTSPSTANSTIMVMRVDPTPARSTRSGAGLCRVPSKALRSNLPLAKVNRYAILRLVCGLSRANVLTFTRSRYRERGASSRSTFRSMEQGQTLWAPKTSARHFRPGSTVSMQRSMCTSWRRPPTWSGTSKPITYN